MTKQIIMPAIILAVICLIVSCALALTHDVTEPLIIKAQKEADELSRTEVLSKAQGFTKVDNTDEFKNVVDVYKSNNDVGYVLTIKTKGYGGVVKIMVGISDEGKISGVKVTEQKETPGLGTKITKEKFTDTFLDTDSKTSTEVDTIAGATISSKAFKAAVSDAYICYDALSRK